MRWSASEVMPRWPPEQVTWVREGAGGEDTGLTGWCYWDLRVGRDWVSPSEVGRGVGQYTRTVKAGVSLAKPYMVVVIIGSYKLLYYVALTGVLQGRSCDRSYLVCSTWSFTSTYMSTPVGYPA